MSSHAERYDGVEMHMVAGKLFLTAVEQPETQISLSEAAIEGLMGYLTETQAIAGWVKFTEEGVGSAHIYRLTIENREHPKKSEVMGMVVDEVEVVLVETEEYFERASEDKRNGYRERA